MPPPERCRHMYLFSHTAGATCSGNIIDFKVRVAELIIRGPPHIGHFYIKDFQTGNVYFVADAPEMVAPGSFLGRTVTNDLRLLEPIYEKLVAKMSQMPHRTLRNDKNKKL